jgi:NADPH-dependent curcumin reductase CurA
MRRLTIKGFFSPDFMHCGEAINRVMRRWLDDGRIQLPFDQSQGLEQTLVAYRKLSDGKNIGKVVVALDR